MAIKAVFAGINKHLDSTIPELNGARRYATVLWALFTDTIEGLRFGGRGACHAVATEDPRCWVMFKERWGDK